MKPPNKTRRFVLALLIIIPAFGLIGGMMIMQAHTSLIISSSLDEDIDKTELERKTQLIDQLNESNQTFFNILLPVFGAWVGAVVAFYFGSENLDKAQEANTELSKLISGKRGNITIRQLLEFYPNSEDVQKVTLSDKMSDVIKATEKYKNSVVINDGKILGVLYLHQIKKFKDRSEEKLEDVLDEIDNHLTDTSWSEKKTIKNYAELRYDDSLLAAKEKMTSFGEGNQDVIGLVIENGEIKAAINLSTLLRWFAS
ncbi:MAG: hypothetical protein GWN01_05055 [Nitrosopumilaceae archaeon]|nr:hypothetical protein [Nitrosopumilaceae archaeon]NIU00312.1 hypothetical protein [Nitrosopumilaceae archaeon]NIU86714.1 hypothetical protein [Nitrosopumilaceae archaeon]NIV65415.1 hypothetical protein [Nitrosopumilaceae archaeon]NIX60914.1 hypothetical protein [Nitrosopumilaceae archaeon]